MRIDIYGFFGGITGWSTHSRNFARALARFHDVRKIHWHRDGTIPPERSDPSADVAICIGPATFAPAIQGRYRIAFFVGETTLLTSEQRTALLTVEEVWVPSRWGRDILVANGIPGASVHIVPEGVDPDLFRPANDRPPRPFRFLFLGKWEKRKGITGLLRCFSSMFSPDEDVELVLHTYVSRPRGYSIRRAMAAMKLGSTAPIRLSPVISEATLSQLYQACDAFVLPTRGEGWGLPIIEAMASGLPALTTAYGAPLDYLNAGNGFPIRVRDMVPVRDPLYFDETQDWGEWAEPDWMHLAWTMREAFENREEAKRRGARAREDIASRWTWNHAAEVADQRLRVLAPA